MDVPIADGVMDTANGGWIVCSEENMLMYDMAHRSKFGSPEAFEAAVAAAFDAGYVPKMWIPKKGDHEEDAQTTPGASSP